MQVHPAKIGHVLIYSPCLLGQEVVFHARQACKKQTDLMIGQDIPPERWYIVDDPSGDKPYGCSVCGRKFSET